ncbi:hypothetical protein GSI_06035 [Ganoderma sinense ZZ0214-1]|uniref:SUN domain-containing protein n=1 Tax=Ganoderma sinense ZZ0214-1 TaxID=1077348 RepID=A0A2G8SC49_9APHY|nr:hypothetical protein GSI_06035 [Ganoderma sinense ZZ0214-1]
MAESLQQLVNEDTKIKVSSTLDKSVGKKCLIDGSPETCWTSQQGTPQHVQLTFAAAVIPKHIELTFQGGFVGTRTLVEVLLSGEQKWRTLSRIYPEDVNRKQVFDLTVTEADLVDAQVESVKLVFEESSDFFGRITVYNLQILGSVPA